MDTIISNTQTGYITGRYIGDSTRLIYYIMKYTVKDNNIDGLLMLIDLEKAFDSVSWEFMYNVLTFLGFPTNIVEWVKLFNDNIIARVLQSGSCPNLSI